MKINLVAIEKDGYVRLQTHESITVADFGADGGNPLQQVLGPGWAANRIMIDLSQTDYIDSSAVGWLISTQSAMRKAGGRFVICMLQPRVKQILDVLKVGKAVPMVGTAEEARQVLLENAMPGGNA